MSCPLWRVTVSFATYYKHRCSGQRREHSLTVLQGHGVSTLRCQPSATILGAGLSSPFGPVM